MQPSEPPDGGYGWVVCLVGCVINVFIKGSGFSVAVLLKPFIEYYNTTLTFISFALQALRTYTANEHVRT